ncbi:hypothetical protein ANN_19402 [Periplaneta americana]|uniref:Uncharacterized protein n=1 Tax=Periplaneta americana TaxID=6978 RepID=A0ABQ8S9T7_PERAM|nr:hypothetical protein ANN_19402 [Periplaneta americana]
MNAFTDFITIVRDEHGQTVVLRPNTCTAVRPSSLPAVPVNSCYSVRARCNELKPTESQTAGPRSPRKLAWRPQRFLHSSCEFRAPHVICCRATRCSCRDGPSRPKRRGYKHLGAHGSGRETRAVVGYTAKNKKDILYPNIPSAIRIIPHGPDIPVLLPPESDTLPSGSRSTETESPMDHTYEPGNTGDDRCFNQSELNDLVKDLNLPKESAELLGSRLKEKKVLAEGTYFSWYWHRQKELVPFLAEEENLVYFQDILAVLKFYNINYNSKEWRFFIDSSKKSLKGEEYNAIHFEASKRPWKCSYGINPGRDIAKGLQLRDVSERMPLLQADEDMRHNLNMPMELGDEDE